MKERKNEIGAIQELSETISKAFKNGNNLFICGNGGSAAEADHMAAELVGKYMIDDRPALPAYSLTNSPAILTSLGNDIGFENVFSRQVEAYGNEGDILLVLTTSDAIGDHSKNLLNALNEAKSKGMITAGLVSKERTHDLPLDMGVYCEGSETFTIQENQLRALHNICGIVEKAFA